MKTATRRAIHGTTLNSGDEVAIRFEDLVIRVTVEEDAFGTRIVLRRPNNGGAGYATDIDLFRDANK